jgi:iron complex transport system ATP-binding protein
MNALSPLTTTEVLRLIDVDFVRGGRLILDNIQLTVRPGEQWALLGANGAGKSTILSLCGAVAHPTRGEVRVLGHTLGRVDLRELRAVIGHVNPRHPLNSGISIFDVVLTGATGTIELMTRWEPSAGESERAIELMELLGIREKSTEPWTTLSQGERGRTLIARALMSDPSLLLLDEPSTGLDVASREQLLDTLDRLRATHPALATVLVTHHLEELPTSTTHAMLLKAGRVTAAGPAETVLTSATVSDCFDYPLDIELRHGRWRAHRAS